MAVKHLVAHVIATIKGQRLNFKSMRIAAGGVFSFGSGIDPEVFEVGAQIRIDLMPEQGGREILSFEAVLCREYNKDGLIWSAKFLKNQEAQPRLLGLIDSFGVDPPYIRKNPRIPNVNELKYMPALAVVFYEPRNISFHVANVSMGGCALWTEDPHGMLVKFDETIEVEFQPRTDFNAISYKGRVTRVEHDVDLGTMNIVYRLGVQYQEFTDEQKTLFVSMMQNVLEELKVSG